MKVPVLLRKPESMSRYTTVINAQMPLLGIDLGYSAKAKSCGVARSGSKELHALSFGECIDYTAFLIREHSAHVLILEAVLSTYHRSDGNPDIRGDFEKGRGWYHGPGVATYAAALRFLEQLDQQLPQAFKLPVVEGFLSYKPTPTRHTEDARRLVDEFALAERFRPRSGSKPISSSIDGVPQIRRFNAPVCNLSAVSSKEQ